MIREEIKRVIEGAIMGFEIPEFSVEKPAKKAHGDYSSNIAMILCKKIGKNPLEIAKDISKKIEESNKNIFKKVEAASPGFLNFFLADEYLKKQAVLILKSGKNFGDLKIGEKKKLNIEFISANPTGPLTLGNGRGGFCGDSLANVLEKSGFNVCREYYINDAGLQVRKLGQSISSTGEIIYKGKYIEELKKKIKEKDLDKIGSKAAQIILKEMIRPSVKKMGIKFDKWFSESDLYEKKEIDKAIKELSKKGLTYEKEGALWFKSTDFGDDKDRVLIKSDKEKTYFASDIAYLRNKMKRGFKELVFLWGADHHGYIQRLKSAGQAFGFDKNNIKIVLFQLVKMFKDGQEVKMSKRAGTYITIDELIDEVGLDAARFFFLSRPADNHLDFDVNLAKEKSEKNPVYYCQYSYARICSIINKIKNQKLKIKIDNSNLKYLSHESEFELIKEMMRFPEIIDLTAKDFQIQRIPQYAESLALSFNHFYRDCQVIVKDKKVFQSRLALVSAVKSVFETAFALMGISSPKAM